MPPGPARFSDRIAGLVNRLERALCVLRYQYDAESMRAARGLWSAIPRGSPNALPAHSTRRSRRPQTFRKSAGVPATAFYEIFDAAAPETSKRSPEFDPARPSRALRAAVEGFATGIAGQVRGGYRHRLAQRCAAANERDACVVGNVEPLVAVSRPRVRGLDTRDECALGRRRGCPQSKGTIDVQPRANTIAPLSQCYERVGAAAVHVTGLRAHDGRPVDLRKSSARMQPWSSVSSSMVRSRPAEHAEPLAHGGMDFRSDDDIQLRSAEQTRRNTALREAGLE